MKCWAHAHLLQCCMAVCLTSVSCFWPAAGPSLKACQQYICRPDSHSVNLQEQTAHEQIDITLMHTTFPLAHNSNAEALIGSTRARVSVYALEMIHMQCAVTTRKMAFKPLSPLSFISCPCIMDIDYVYLSMQ